MISVPSLETSTPGDRSHPYRKDRWRLHLIFVVIQVERETVMTVFLSETGMQSEKDLASDKSFRKTFGRKKVTQTNQGFQRISTSLASEV